MKHFIILLTFILVFVNTKAQSGEDSVKNTINALFAAMKNADSAAAKSLFSSNAMLQTISEHPQKGTSVQTETVDAFAGMMNKIKKGSCDEQIVFDGIKIDGAMAQVWTPYKFYYNQQFSHCGVNAFLLVRFKEGWKIQYIIDTRRKDNCK
jgi:hypothetical protein